MSREPRPEELDAYMHLSKQDIARLVLCLLIEETLGGRLVPFRSPHEHLHAEPVQGSEELVVGGGDVAPVRARAG
jgi:hypothetical protein